MSWNLVSTFSLRSSRKRVRSSGAHEPSGKMEDFGDADPGRDHNRAPERFFNTVLSIFPHGLFQHYLELSSMIR